MSAIRPNLSLEEQFPDLAFPSVIDLKTKNNDWAGEVTFLPPNEEHPEAIIPHLDLKERGVVVSTGTERCDFLLIFIKKEICEGLIGRDLNPNAKAYRDYNKMLYKVSDDFKDYRNLRFFLPLNHDYRYEEIRKKIQNASLSERESNYYLTNLVEFEQIYRLGSQFWPYQSGYSSCAYPQNPALFEIVRTYAKEGNTINTIGSINDLTFIENRNVILVDTSNICDYTYIDLKGNAPFSPRIILTKVNSGNTKFRSAEYNPPNETEREHLNKLINRIETSKSGRRVLDADFPKWGIMDPDNIPFLENHISKNLIEIEGEDYNFEFPGSGSHWTKDQMVKIAATDGISRMFPRFLEAMFSELKDYNILCTDWLFSLLGAKGFKKALTEYLTPRQELHDKLIASLEKHGLVDQFEAEMAK